MSLSVSAIPPESVDDVWPSLEPMIEKGLKYGQGDSDTLATMKESIVRGDTHLWAAHEDGDIVAGMILRLIEYPAKKTVFIEMLAGRDMVQWFDEHFHLLEKFRDLNGADTIEASCRNGMAMFLGKHGWTHKAVIMEAPK